MEVFVVWVLLAIIVAYVADKKGRNGFLWGIYGFLIPLIALIHVLLVEANGREIEQRAIEGGQSKKCPKCAEVVRREAAICRFCGHDFYN